MGSTKTFLDENFANKANCEHCCKNLGYQKGAVTKSSSLWHTRNNSSNVSSLLAPDFEQISAKSASNSSTIPKPIRRRTIISAGLTSKGSDVAFHCEECYCRQNPNLPLLNFAPQYRHEMEQRRSNLRSNIYYPRVRKADHGVKRLPKSIERKTRTCSCGNNSSNLVESSFSKDTLNLTNTRREYESKLGDLHKIDESEEISGPQDDYRSEELATITYDKPKSYQDFKELAKFRNEQYFDCHSTNDVNASSGIPQHKCVHKFVLDDRLLPQPLNGDSYGISRCDICNKPMETLKSERPRSRTTAKSINKVKEIYEYNLAPHKLNVGSGKETVQIKVPEGLGREVLWQYNNFKIKRKVPGNSFALRYQRGRV